MCSINNPHLVVCYWCVCCCSRKEGWASIKKIFFWWLFCQSSTIFSPSNPLATCIEPMPLLRAPGGPADHLCRGPGAKDEVYSPPFCSSSMVPFGVLMMAYSTLLGLLGRHFWFHFVDRKLTLRGWGTCLRSKAGFDFDPRLPLLIPKYSKEKKLFQVKS